MSKEVFNSKEYKDWLNQIKSKISASQIKAALFYPVSRNSKGEYFDT